MLPTQQECLLGKRKITKTKTIAPKLTENTEPLSIESASASTPIQQVVWAVLETEGLPQATTGHPSKEPGSQRTSSTARPLSFEKDDKSWPPRDGEYPGSWLMLRQE